MTPPLAAIASAALCLGLWSGLAGAASGEAAPPGWREIAIPAAQFRVLMPGAPKTSRRTIRTEIGEVASTRYTLIDNANVTYDVLFNVYPKAGIAKATPDKMLDGARDALLYHTGGRMVNERPTVVSGHPGRDHEIQSKDGKHYRIRLVWAGNRLYQIMTVTPGAPRAESQIFFDSFRILGSR